MKTEIFENFEIWRNAISSFQCPIVSTDLKLGDTEYNHCRVPDKEWSFQDGGLYIIKKVGTVTSRH